MMKPIHRHRFRSRSGSSGEELVTPTMLRRTSRVPEWEPCEAARGSIQFPSWPLDCFVWLAMTGRVQRQHRPVIARSPCDDRVRRSSKSEGGSDPVLFPTVAHGIFARARNDVERSARQSRAMATRPLHVIARSSCDDRVRRSSKSDGGSDPVLLPTWPWVASQELAMTLKGPRVNRVRWLPASTSRLGRLCPAYGGAKSSETNAVL
jgi:hypothetical protein